ncbi:MAG: gluconokinase [Pseudolabrys sp.]|nr:gluconokinase [Pseudolabrys sp.]MDP2294434.1 gluconokinase [Pseudolabrys sp.]
MAQRLPTRTTAIVVMGVSGAGKSTIASRLAERLKRPLVEGDSLHPQANIAKMSKGTPLNDDDRLPWLKAIAARIDEARKAHTPIIVTCSALKRGYREILTDGHDDVGFVYLQGAKELIAQRLAARTDHFMPPGLLDSQFSALEEPAADEPSIVIAIDAAPDDIVSSIIGKFRS